MLSYYADTKLIYFPPKKSLFQNIKISKCNSLFTIVAKNITCKKLNFVNDEVWAGCPKLGHSTYIQTFEKGRGTDSMFSYSTGSHLYLKETVHKFFKNL